MNRSILRIATRKSPLALWQATHVGNLIKGHWPDVTFELVPMLTSGDRFLKDKLQTIGGKGLFVKELEEALLDNRADLAVHSMKDVPVLLTPELGIIAVCKRDNPLDALISRHHQLLNNLPAKSVIGTTSLRRQSQLMALRPDFIIKPLRGNIHTRLSKLQNGEFDAIILAAAGLERMGMQDNISEVLNEQRMIPACGQGAMGVECRNQDKDLQQLLLPLHHLQTSTCVAVERRVNALLGGNCHVPLAVFCTSPVDKQLLLRARLLSMDGKTCLSYQGTCAVEEGLSLAEMCANSLLAQGGRQLLELQ